MLAALTHPSRNARPVALSFCRPSPAARGPWGEAAAPGLARVRAPAGPAFPLRFLLLEHWSTCCACPETSLPDSPSPPRVGVAPADPGRSPQSWLPPPSSSALESALSSEALRLHVVRWRGPRPDPRLGPEFCVCGGPRGCAPSTPCGSSHRECRRNVAEGGDGGFWGLPPPLPASSPGELAELGWWELGRPPTWARGGGVVTAETPGHRMGQNLKTFKTLLCLI